MTYVFPPLGWSVLMASRPSLGAVVAGTIGPRSDLDAVNTGINRGVLDLADTPGKDVWSIAARGDCEDHALMKRAALIGLGWPSSALRLAVCDLPTGEPHLVLVVDTQTERLALDNIIQAVVPIAKTGYTFRMIQTKTDPKVWREWPG
jgi:predicted transglutaminase-like cysteine proteinase